MREVSALCGPERGCAESEDNGSRDERCKRRVELGRNVGNVAKHGKDQSPFGGELLN